MVAHLGQRGVRHSGRRWELTECAECQCRRLAWRRFSWRALERSSATSWVCDGYRSWWRTWGSEGSSDTAAGVARGTEGARAVVVLRPAQVREFAARLDALRAPGTSFSAVRPFRSGDVGMLAKWAPHWSEIETPDTQCQAANTSKLVLNYSVY